MHVCISELYNLLWFSAKLGQQNSSKCSAAQWCDPHSQGTVLTHIARVQY